MSVPVQITASYAFFSLTPEEVRALHAELTRFGIERGMKGLVLIAEEGINATVCGTRESIDAWKETLRALCPSITFKDSHADAQVFRRWRVKIKPEIVALRDPSVHPAGKRRHLSPEEWNEMMSRDDVTVVDARNSYEFAVGKFKNAVDCGTRSFHQFPAFAQQAALPKEKPVLLYCTGGIRCEKAVYAMEQAGYCDVYQLDGGILAYLEQFPNAQFEGECFVFDERVAVDQELKPSTTFRLCEKTGDPVRM